MLWLGVGPGSLVLGSHETQSIQDNFHQGMLHRQRNYIWCTGTCLDIPFALHHLPSTSVLHCFTQSYKIPPRLLIGFFLETCDGCAVPYSHGPPRIWQMNKSQRCDGHMGNGRKATTSQALLSMVTPLPSLLIFNPSLPQWLQWLKSMPSAV